MPTLHLKRVQDGLLDVSIISKVPAIAIPHVDWHCSFLPKHTQRSACNHPPNQWDNPYTVIILDRSITTVNLITKGRKLKSEWYLTGWMFWWKKILNQKRDNQPIVSFFIFLNSLLYGKQSSSFRDWLSLFPFFFVHRFEWNGHHYAQPGIRTSL